MAVLVAVNNLKGAYAASEQMNYTNIPGEWTRVKFKFFSDNPYLDIEKQINEWVHETNGRIVDTKIVQSAHDSMYKTTVMITYIPEE